MRLVGAGKTYIRAPFMVEGVLYGLIAAIVTLLLLYPLTWWLGSATANFFGGIDVFSYFLSHFALFFLVIAGSGVGARGRGELARGAALPYYLIRACLNIFLLWAG